MATTLSLAMLVGILLAIVAVFHRVTQGTRKSMSAIDDLKNAEQDLETKVDALLAFAATQQTDVAALQAQLAAAGSVDPAVQAVVDRMRAEGAKIAAFLPQPSATPAT